MGVEDIREAFAPLFLVAKFEDKRRRLAPSRWFWLERTELAGMNGSEVALEGDLVLVVEFISW